VISKVEIGPRRVSNFYIRVFEKVLRTFINFLFAWISMGTQEHYNQFRCICSYSIETYSDQTFLFMCTD